MKSSLKAIAFATVFSAVFAFNSFAGDKEAKKTTAFGTGIFASKTGKIHVAVDKYNNENTVLIVTDATGKAIYREAIGKEVAKFRKTLNVSDLPAGTYTIEVISKGESQTKKFEVQETKVQREISLL